MAEVGGGLQGRRFLSCALKGKENFKCKDKRHLDIFGMSARAKVGGRRDLAMVAVVILWFGEVVLLWPWR